MGATEPKIVILHVAMAFVVYLVRHTTPQTLHDSTGWNAHALVRVQ